ncbi:hypothetical protein O1611_g3127 [Lasiodiplodia mahajangana]|uniref:Uncharacterized protein n=1 Tax=Lasiodiplodia mahajangana TaxID=1108764 RepID=A0ACC2JSN9_9PEZI|nr:hypothetical protein O1611_g3127 [Lasiodiplodia mahajangana]
MLAQFVVDDGPCQASPSDLVPHSTNSQRVGHQECPASVSESTCGLGPDEGWPLVGQSPLSNIEIELLKHYCHRVAPWLDVYDQDQTFSHYVPKLAMTSPCVLEVLLQLAAASSGRPIEVVTRRGAGIFHLQAMSDPQGTESPSSALRMIACFVISRTILFVDRDPEMWERSFQGDGAFFYFRRFRFLDTTQRQMWLGFLTLILRLEIAYCLLNQTDPAWVPELARHIQAQSGTNETGDIESRQILNASLQCLKLLLDTMSFCFAPEVTTRPSMSPISSGTRRAGNWRVLMGRLYAWYKSRPSSLEPLVDVENPESAFRLIMFSSGAGISSNALYHTAMFLLLSNKPPLASADEQRTESDVDESQTSPRWHALRICGIAINKGHSLAIEVPSMQRKNMDSAHINSFRNEKTLVGLTQVTRKQAGKGQ